jgi:hypothetical protein
VPPVAAWLVVGVWLAAGCTGALQSEVRSAADRRDPEAAIEAYGALRDAKGPHPGALARVAMAVLEDAALGDDDGLRDAALSELRMAERAGEPALRRIVDADAPEAAVARAVALEVLASRGRRGRRRALRGLLDGDDPRVVAAAVTALDAVRDRARLLAFMDRPTSVVRAAAARQLAGARASAEVRWALADAARRDPDPAVRAAATRALSAQGPAAVAGL